MIYHTVKKRVLGNEFHEKQTQCVSGDHLKITYHGRTEIFKVFEIRTLSLG